MNLFDLFVKISADTKEAESGIDAIGEKMKDVAKSAEEMAKSVGEAFKKVGEAAKEIDSVVSGVGDKIVKAFAGAAAAVGGFAVGLAKAGVEYNAQMETYQMAFTTLLGSAEEARAAMAQIQTDAASTPFDVAGLTQANQLLVGAGASAEEARNVIMALGDAVSATGGGNDELLRMAANLQQIKNVGKASAIDVKQFALAGINIYQVLADSMGITVKEASSIKPTYEQLSAALISAASEGGRYFGAMANQSLTFNGQISNLEDNWSALLGSLTSGLQEILQGDMLPRIIGYVDEIQAAFDSGGFAGVADTLGSIFADALDGVMAYLPGFVSGVMDTLVSLVSSLDVSGVIAAFDEIVGSAFGALDGILDVLAPMVEQIVPALVKAFVQYQGAIREVGVTIITAIAVGIADNIDSILGTVAETVGSLVETVSACAPQFLAAGVTIITALAHGFVSALSSFDASAAVGGIMTVLQTVVQVITDTLPEIITSVTQVVSDLIVALTDPATMQVLVTSAMAIIGALAEGIMGAIPILIETVVQVVNNLAAWLSDPANLGQMAEMATGIIQTVIDGLSGALPQLIEAAILIIGVLAEGLVSALPMLADAVVSVIGSLVAYIADPANLAAAADAAMGIIDTLIDGIASALPQIATVAVQIVMALAEALLNPNALANIINTAFSLVMQLVDALVDAAPQIATAAVELVTGFVEFITGPANIANIIDAAFTILQSLSDGLLQAIPELLQAAIDIIMAFCSAVVDPENIERLFAAAANMLSELVNGLIEAIPLLLSGAVSVVTGLAGFLTNPESLGKVTEAAESIIKSLGEGIINFAKLLLEAAVTCMTSLAEAFTSFDWSGTGRKIVDGIKNGITQAWSSLKEWVSGLMGDLMSIGGDIVGGIKDGISNAWDGLKNMVTGKSESIEDTARSALDMHSPSRVMARVGADAVDGIIVGWQRRMEVLERMVSEDSYALSAYGVGVTPYEESTAHAAAAVARDFAPTESSGGTYTINLQIDGQTIATAVFDPLRAEAKRRGETIA